jgi:hypothetical protein
LIEPLDDIRAGNPPTNPELLDYLTQQLIDSGFDTRHVLRQICRSRTYQLAIQTNPWNADDTVNYSRGSARRLPAEVCTTRSTVLRGRSAAFPESRREPGPPRCPTPAWGRPMGS